MITKSEPFFLVCFGFEITCEKKKSSHFLYLFCFFFFLFETLGCLNDDVRDQKTNGGRERFFVVVVGFDRKCDDICFTHILPRLESNGS